MLPFVYFEGVCSGMQLEIFVWERRARLVHSFLICLQLEAWLTQHRVPIPPTIVAR